MDFEKTSIYRLGCAALLVLFGSAAPVAGQIDLTAGRVAKFTNNAGSDKDNVIVKFVKDPLVTAPLPNPTCPNVSSVTFRTDTQQIGPIALDCSKWEEKVAQTKYLYRDPAGSAGGITKIVFRVDGSGGKIVVKANGAGYGADPVVGPASFVETELMIDGATYCGRFESPPSGEKQNDPDRIFYKPPSVACVPQPGASPTTTATKPPTDTATATPTATPTHTPTTTPSSSCSTTQVVAVGPGLAQSITDDGYTGHPASMTCVNVVVPATCSGTLTATSVQVGMAHTMIGDLTVKLVSPASTTVTLMSRPGAEESYDRGDDTPQGDTSNLATGYPITFVMGAAASAEDMGSVLNTVENVCQDDSICSFAPNPGAADPGDLDSFNGQMDAGTWQFCVGDSRAGEIGSIDKVTLTLSH